MTPLKWLAIVIVICAAYNLLVALLYTKYKKTKMEAFLAEQFNWLIVRIVQARTIDRHEELARKFVDWQRMWLDHYKQNFTPEIAELISETQAIIAKKDEELTWLQLKKLGCSPEKPESSLVKKPESRTSTMLIQLPVGLESDPGYSTWREKQSKP